MSRARSLILLVTSIFPLLLIISDDIPFPARSWGISKSRLFTGHNLFSFDTRFFSASSSSNCRYPVGETLSIMCRCSTSECPGLRIPGHSPFWCRDNVFVFIVEPCENESSGDCIPTWRPDPRGNHDQCSNCARTQRYIYPEGALISTSKRKVHTPRHAAPNYAPPLYVRPPGYEDSELRVVPNSTAAAGPEQHLTPTRSNLTVVPPTPTRGLP